MKSTHRKASTAKRKWQADPSSIYRTFAKVQAFTGDELATLQTPVRIAFERMRTGCAQDGDFDTLAASINIALVRGEAIDPLCVETAYKAQEGLMRCLARFETTGRWGFDGPALQDIPMAIDLYEQMLTLSTPLQMHSAMQETVTRMNKGVTL